MLPPIDMISLLFLRQIFLGRKKLLKDTEVIRSCVARYKELNAKVALQFCLSDPVLAQYIPDNWKNGKKISREYLWTLISSIRFNFYN